MMAEAAVYKYLSGTNRPYSANDITLNLHKEFGKTAIQKGLDELVEQNRIREKVYGKQKVYCILQGSSTNNDSNINELDEIIKDRQRTLLEINKELTNSEARLKELLAELTSTELESENNELDQINLKLKERLETLSSGNVQLITEDEQKKMRKEHDDMASHQKKRKRMAVDILDSILEGYPKSKKCLYEEIGIELDP